MGDIEFRFVQPNEFDDWYYECIDHDGYWGDIFYSEGEWSFCIIKEGIGITQAGLEKILRKIEELNATTKPKNRFGF